MLYIFGCVLRGGANGHVERIGGAGEPAQKEREDFNDAIYGIIKFAKDEMSKPNGAMTREEASAMLEGKTAKEIIELHKSLARKKRVPRYTR